MLPFSVAVRLISILLHFTTDHERQEMEFELEQVLDPSDRVNMRALRDVEISLARLKRFDLADVLQETIHENLSLLEDFETEILGNRERFHNPNANGRNNTTGAAWPARLYRFSPKGNPIRAKSGFTQYGAVLEEETQPTPWITEEL